MNKYAFESNRPVLASAIPCVLALVLACSDNPQISRLSSDAVILAFGDSLTRSVGVEPADSYPSVLARQTGFKVINAGVPGETTALGLKRLPALLDRINPDLVILCHGGNDILRRQSMAEAEENIRRMLQEARQREIDVVLVAVPKLGLWGSPPQLYERLAEEFQVPIEAKALSELERSPDMKSDSVHLNEAGYRNLATAIQALLRKSGAI